MGMRVEWFESHYDNKGKRRVEWFKDHFDNKEKGWIKKSQGEAVFHQYWRDYEELSDGVGCHTTAIIGLPDGTVKSIPVEDIKFINKL